MSAITAPSAMLKYLAVRMGDFREMQPVMIAQASPRPADTRVLRVHAPQGSGIRMRSWPIRRKLVGIPMFAAVLLTVTTLVALDSDRHRFWLIAGLDGLILAIMVAAWAAADA